MALTADEKEAIMAARGESAHTAKLISTKIRVYDVEFSDGRTCAALDMTTAPAEQKIKDIHEQFQPGYVVKVIAR